MCDNRSALGKAAVVPGRNRRMRIAEGRSFVTPFAWRCALRRSRFAAVCTAVRLEELVHKEAVMQLPLAQACDAALARTTKNPARVHGAVGMLTNRSATMYAGASGHRMFGGGEPLPPAMTTDTVFGLFSCTKALTSVVVMQLVESGLIDLDAPAREYCPELGELQVLEGFDLGGTPRLRAPRREVTARTLMLHTAGFGYDFFNENYRRLCRKDKVPSILSCVKASMCMPLLFDPGERWEYGLSMDWCGQIAEAVTGKRLGGLMREGIFEPLGMRDTGFTLSASMRERLATLHQRERDGSLTPLPGFTLPASPEVDMGGHGLYSTAGDFTRFMRMLLNEGMGKQGPVLRPETVRAMSENGLGTLKVRPLKNAYAQTADPFELLPGVSKSWGYSFMINDEPAPTGRPAGSLAWAGMANAYYWIDLKNGLGGFWATQILPFGDSASCAGFVAFEKAVYNNATPPAA